MNENGFIYQKVLLSKCFGLKYVFCYSSSNYLSSPNSSFYNSKENSLSKLRERDNTWLIVSLWELRDEI